ncbi:hypothetical protein [Amycolatopsis sp. DSM 110486]|uniref:hypothetical protein n=1 Tax=Amycolatopsis sp. DSM 110486 TaxID=2865832 RepID=UPI001C6A3666|nr:hypothetical protein [Amycolatopsis sp. DSM 110486]QYN22640.1 hypothetical protein K1T34_09270 [Amycolatopsis sp. DSM 110486]
MTLRPLLAGTALAAAALVLAGCGGAPSAGSAPSVAALPSSASAASPSATTSADDARPLIRPDTDPAERDRLTRLWIQCLTDHGIPDYKRDHDNPNPKFAGAREACAPKQPEDLKDRLARKDPAAYQDGMRDLANCMRSHGIEVKIDATGYTYDPNGSVPIADAMVISADCEKVAFGAR